MTSAPAFAIHSVACGAWKTWPKPRTTMPERGRLGAYDTEPLCTNTRVALITGRYKYGLPIGLVEPLRWSDRDAPEMGIPPGHPTLPALLRGAGYCTMLIGKWHLGYLPRYSPLKSGY